MQAGGMAQGPTAIPRRTRLSVLLSIAGLAAAMVMLVVVASILMTRGEVLEDATYNAQAPQVGLYDNEGIARQIHVRSSGVAQPAPWVTPNTEEKSNVDGQVDGRTRGVAQPAP